MTMIRHLLLAFLIIGTAIARACLAFKYFWNIPALGEIQPPDGPRARTTYRI